MNDYRHIVSDVKLKDDNNEIIIPYNSDSNGFGAWVIVSDHRRGIGTQFPRKLKKKLFGTRRMRKRWNKKVKWFGVTAKS